MEENMKLFSRDYNKNKIEQLLLKYKHGNNIYEHEKRQNE